MTVVPNAFQISNLYIDRAMSLLTDPELRVLLFTIRHIMGWQDKINDRKGCISLTMYENGFTTKAGVHYNGCGLKRGAIIKAIQQLVEFGFIARIGKPSDKGQEYQLIDSIDWVKLEARQSAKQALDIKRTAKATNTRVSSTSDVPVTSDVTMQGNVPRTMQGNVGRTESKSYSNTNTKSAVQSTDGRDPVFDAVAEYIFNINPLEVNKETGGRIGVISSWLNGKSDGLKRNGGKVGYISRPAEPEHVKRFAAWYKAKHPNISMPRDLLKFVDYWRQWATEQSKAAAAARPAPAPEPEVTEAQRAELLEAVRMIRPDWEALKAS